MMPGAKDRDRRARARKEAGLPRRGDARAGYGKDPPPKGGRNRRGRGRAR